MPQVLHPTPQENIQALYNDTFRIFVFSNMTSKLLTLILEAGGRRQGAGRTHVFKRGNEVRTLYTALRVATLTRCASRYNSFYELGLRPRTKVSIDTHNLLPSAS